jgi:hypothetical protein
MNQSMGMLCAVRHSSLHIVHVYVYDLTLTHFQQKGPHTMILYFLCDSYVLVIRTDTAQHRTVHASSHNAGTERGMCILPVWLGYINYRRINIQSKSGRVINMFIKK